MPQRSMDSDYWRNEFIQSLPWDAKGFYQYLITNHHVTPSGVFRITLKTICFDTGIDPKVIPGVLEALSSKVKWYQDKNIVWVKNFIFRQSKSPKFIQAVSRHLTELKLNGIAKEVIDYNSKHHKLSIPYPYRTYGVATKKDELSKTAVDTTLNESQNKELGEISRLYEENIGMLTPLLGERLKEIVGEYPDGWFAKATQEAVNYNHRNLRYIERVLENWKVNGVKTGMRPVGEQTKTGQRKVNYHDVKEPKNG